MMSRTGSLGVWLIGARGSVAATTVTGALAVRAGLAGGTGLVSELPQVASAGLPELDRLVFGGHDTAPDPLPKRVERLAAGGVLPAGLVAPLTGELEAVEHRIRPGYDGSGVSPDTSGAHGEETQGEAVARLRGDLEAFAREHDLDRVVVIDVASTESPVPADRVRDTPALREPDALRAALAAGQAPLPSSSVYVLAAYDAGFPVVSFTPSPGPRLPVLTRIAEQAGLCWAGSDGKTGETLLKSALAPMFATRALQIGSWSSFNLLGGGDGATLADPEKAASKLATKAHGLESILGHSVQGPMHIDNVPDHGDWKTAIDHVTFTGFLGVGMSFQFTWTGCDSALAAPLVLDLARLALRADQIGDRGPLPFGFFFKDPAFPDGEPEEHRLSEQWQQLTDWCARAGARG